MINDQKVSCLLLTHHPSRMPVVDEICMEWLKEPIDELILCDCTKTGFKNLQAAKDGRFQVVSFSKDPGIRARHTLALLSRGDFVIQADDDVMPKNGFATDLYNGWEIHDGIVGIIGRKFTGSDYRKGSTFFRSSKIDKITPVDWVGVVYGCGRDCLIMDMRDLETAYSDLFWCCEAHKDKPKHVIQTQRYENLPSCNDNDCLFHNQNARAIRQDYYAGLWESHYKIEDLIK